MTKDAIMIEPDDLRYSAVFDTKYGAVAVVAESEDSLKVVCESIGVLEVPFDTDKVQRVRITQRRQ